MWLDLIVEYVAGFAFGLFIFQSLFMKSVMGGTYWQNVRKSFVPELISMNFMMAGMCPVMSFVMMGRDMRAMVPTELLFWGAMSIGVIAGFAMAFPWNVWLVAQSLKHGLMTERQPGSKCDLQAARTGHSSSSPHMSHAAKTSPGKVAHDDQGEGMPPMPSAMTRAQLAAVCGISILTLAIGLIAPANWLNLRLSARDVGGAIMPRGMIMDRDTPAEAMLDMLPSTLVRSLLATAWRCAAHAASSRESSMA